jgi:hypothetical protein
MSLSGHSHSFDTGIAKELGLHCAIIYNHIIYWLRVNATKGQGFVDGKVWMYESQQQISDFLEYMTLDEVKKAIPKLVESGYVIKGNHNKNPFDKTAWYTIPNQSEIQKSFTKVPIGTFDSADSHDRESDLAPSINKEQTFPKGKVKQQQKKVAKAPVVVFSKEEEEADEAAMQYIKQELRRGNKVNENRIRAKAKKERWKPNKDESKSDLTDPFKNRETYEGIGGNIFECYKNEKEICFHNLNHPTSQPQGCKLNSNKFVEEFKKLLEKLQLTPTANN